MRFLNTNTTGAPAVTIAAANPALNTGSLAKGMIFKMPMTSTWMQSSSVVSDLSSNHAHATIVGNPVVGANFTTLDGTGDRFNYDDSVNNYFNFTNTGNFSASMWIKTAGLTGTLIARRSTQGFVMQMYNNAGTAYADFFMDDATGNKNFQASTTPLNDDVWHNLVFVFNKDLNPMRYIYVDGVQQTTAGTALIGNFAQAEIQMGICGTTAGTALFTGSIRDIFIWNRILTTAEIQLLSKSN
jgi:hypothetical protein